MFQFFLIVLYIRSTCFSWFYYFWKKLKGYIERAWYGFFSFVYVPLLISTIITYWRNRCLLWLVIINLPILATEGLVLSYCETLKTPWNDAWQQLWFVWVWIPKNLFDGKQMKGCYKYLQHWKSRDDLC